MCIIHIWLVPWNSVPDVWHLKKIKRALIFIFFAIRTCKSCCFQICKRNSKKTLRFNIMIYFMRCFFASHGNHIIIKIMFCTKKMLFNNNVSVLKYSITNAELVEEFFFQLWYAKLHFARFDYKRNRKLVSMWRT